MKPKKIKIIINLIKIIIIKKSSIVLITAILMNIRLFYIIRTIDYIIVSKFFIFIIIS